MAKRETAQATLGQVGELVGDIVKSLIKLFFALSSTELQVLVSKKRQLFNKIADVVSEVLGAVGEVNSDLISEWQKFYSEVMGMRVDFSSLVIPIKPEGNWWLIAVVPDITCTQIITALRKLFPVWVYTKDLDKVIDLSKEQRRATFFFTKLV